MIFSRSKLMPALALIAAGLMASACVQSRTLGSGVDDAAADVDLKAKLFQDERYDYSDVDITVFEGRVMLTGTMRLEEGKQHAEQLASRAQNVRAVVNEIVVGDKTPFRQGTRDALIDKQLGAALLADAGVVRGNYQFSVSDGVVYMIGVAKGPTELTLATDHARRIGGVKKVVSHVLYVKDPARNTR